MDGAGFVASADLVSWETVGDSVTEGVGVELCVMVWVGDAEVAVSCGASEELKIEANQIIAINPPIVESDPRFSLTSINHREAKELTSGVLA